MSKAPAPEDAPADTPQDAPVDAESVYQADEDEGRCPVCGRVTDNRCSHV